MCGICGAAWTDDGRALGDPDLAAMTARIEHRGPDDSGSYRDPHAALGFRRLSIVDLAGGHQPLSNEDGTVWTVFNGEIYNFPALRHRLEARGHVLRSRGDTEVLVHLYEDEGPGMFSLLRGMFALAIWDAPRRRLVLARDRLGQKPLIYRHEGDRIVFASELKALLALPEADFPGEVDPQALDQYLTYGYIPHPRTILRGVHKLPPAHFAVWHEGTLELGRYWDPDWNEEQERPPGEDAERLRATLGEAVREQMVADVPLGAFLSGGIDSTIIVGLMQAASDPSREDLLDRVRRPGLRREPLRRDGRAAPGHRAPRVRRGPSGLGDAPGHRPAVRRALRRQLRAAHLAGRPRDAPGGDGGPDRGRRRRALRRLRPLPGAGPGPPPRPAPGPLARVPGRSGGPRPPRLVAGEDPDAQGPSPAGGDRRASRVSLRALGLPVRRARPRPALLRRHDRRAGPRRGRSPRRGRPALGAGPRPRRGPATRPGHPRDDRRPADLPARRPPGQGRPRQHGPQPRMPRPVPRPPRRRARPGDADPPQAPASARAARS